MATYSNNTTVKVSGGRVSLTAGSLSSATYTVPANSYFILSSVYQPNTGSTEILDNGAAIITAQLSAAAGAYLFNGGQYVGPGGKIRFTNGTLSSQTAIFMGVEFINTP